MRILIAEDDQASRLTLLKTLERFGHDCVQPETGEQAYELCQLEEMRPDVVICDRVLPDIDGLELCRRVRKLDPDKLIYVMMLIDPADTKSRAAAFEAGADDYLLKPLDLNELEARFLITARTVSLRHQLVEQRLELER